MRSIFTAQNLLALGNEFIHPLEDFFVCHWTPPKGRFSAKVLTYR